MGADIYIDLLYDGECNSDNGYFRDSYNLSNLLNQIGLDWWTLHEEYGLNNTDSIMSPELAVKFKEDVTEAYNKWLKNVEGKSGEEIEYFRDKGKHLIEFIDKAIKIESGMSWSV